MPNYNELAESRDMTFTLKDETFVVNDVSPDVIEKWEEEEAEDLEDEGEGESKENGKPSETTMQRLDRHIIAFLSEDPDAVKRYKALRARKTNVVPAWMIVAFHNDLYASQTSRPTTSPAPSAPGAGQTARSSGAA